MMANSKLSEKEFEDSFGHALSYGVSGGWPRRTCLFYKFTDWRKSGHHCWDNCYREIAHFKTSTLGSCLHLYIVMDKSPCSECSEHLIHLKNENKYLQISIKFSSFYNLYETSEDKEKCEQHVKNIKGLLKLIKTGIKLYVFNGEEDWKLFLGFVLNVPESEQEEWLVCIRKDEKKQRESVDVAILQDIRHRTLTMEDIMRMASAKSEREVEEELMRRHGKFIFNNDDGGKWYLDSIQDCKDFFNSSSYADLSHYFFKVGSGTWSKCITNEKGIHAEKRMTETIKNEEFQIRAGKFPCHICCETLIAFKAELKCLGTIFIQFQDFNNEPKLESILNGLVKIVENGIKIDRLYGEEKWKYFFATFVRIKDERKCDTDKKFLEQDEAHEEEKASHTISTKRQDKTSTDIPKNRFLEWRKELEIEDPPNGLYLLREIISKANENKQNYEEVLKLLGVRNPKFADIEDEINTNHLKRQGGTSPCRDEQTKRVKSDTL